MEDDDEMPSSVADYGTDLSDDVESIVDPHFDAGYHAAAPRHDRLPSQLLLVTLRTGSRLRQMMTAACMMMLPLSGPASEYEPHAACQSMKLAAECIGSSLQLMLVAHSSMFPLTVSDPE